MSNHFLGRGNLGADPELKHVELAQLSQLEGVAGLEGA